jgi:hypothetical protein
MGMRRASGRDVGGRNTLWLFVHADIHDADAIGRRTAGAEREWWRRWRRWWWSAQMLELRQDRRGSVFLLNDDHLSLVGGTVNAVPGWRRADALVVGRRQDLRW